MCKRCWILLYGLIYIAVIDFALSQKKGLDKSVNLALETVFEFDKDGKSDIQLLSNVQKFIGKVKNVIKKKTIARRELESDRPNVFTDFILNVVSVLNKFQDDDLEKFFGIINNEIKRYLEKDGDARVLNKLDMVKNMPAYVLKWYLKAVRNKIEEEAYYEDERSVINVINDLYKHVDTAKLDGFLNNLDEYRRKSRRDIDLVQIIKTALYNLILDSYYHLQPTAKIALRSILHHYIDGFIQLTTEKPVTVYHHLKESNSVKRAKSKTTRESRTWRQMYVEKNLDLKYPYNYVPVTKKHKRKDKTRTPKSRFVTVPTTRASKVSTKTIKSGKKYGDVIEYDINVDTSKSDNSDEDSHSDNEIPVYKSTKRINKVNLKYNRYSRESKKFGLNKNKPVKFYITGRDKNKKNSNEHYYHKHDKHSSQYKTSKEYDEEENKYKAAHKTFKKLSTFYLDLKADPNYVGNSFDATTPEHELSVAKPIGFNIAIKHGPEKKSKHYGYVQKKRKDVFSKETQLRVGKEKKMKKEKKKSDIVRMLPISLNMQLSMTKDPSTLNHRDTVRELDNFKNLEMRSPLSEEGLSIEGFQETKRKIFSRRSDVRNDTEKNQNNHVLNLIQKLEQDLEAVKTKIHNVTAFKRENNGNGTKSIENEVIDFKTGTSVTPKDVNVRKFYEERDKYVGENKNSNIDGDKKGLKEIYNFKIPDEKTTLKNTAVTKVEVKYNVARKANDQSWYPLVRARKDISDEIIIQRKYEPLPVTPIKQNNNVPINKYSPTKNEVTYEYLTSKIYIKNTIKEKMKNENTTITKNPPNLTGNANVVYSNKDLKEKSLIVTEPHSERKVFDTTVKDIPKKVSVDKTLLKYDVDKTTNSKNTEETVTKQIILNVPKAMKDAPIFRSQDDEINNVENVTLKETITTKKDIIKTTPANIKNTTESVVSVNYMTTRKGPEVVTKANKFTTTVDVLHRRHMELNNNATTVKILDKLKDILTTGITKVDGLKKPSPDKTEVTKSQPSSNNTSVKSRRSLFINLS